MTSLTYGTESGVLTLRRDGRLLASAFDGRDGWMVTRRVETSTHMWFVPSAADARVVLDAIGGTA